MANYNFAVSPWDFLGPSWQRMPAGMRNNNPGNIKYVGQRDALGPSANTDQGDPQAVFASPQAGINAMRQLLGKKYSGGKHTPMEMIAGQGGWTPGNTQAAANVARYSGIGPNDDINFSNPAAANKFIAGLMMQEHGPASKAYAGLLNGGSAAMPAPSPYAGLPDGPKGQESFPGLAGAPVGLAAETTQHPLGGILAGAGIPQDAANEIAATLAGPDDGTGKSRSPFQKLADTPDAPAVRFGQMGDVRQGSDGLLKLLNSPTFADMFLKKRIG